MSRMSFLHVVRGLLVAIGILFAIMQVRLLSAGPGGRGTLDALVLPAALGSR